MSGKLCSPGGVRTGKHGLYTSREGSLRRHPPARPPAARGGWIANDEIDILRPEAMDNTNSTARAQGKNEGKTGFTTFVTSTTNHGPMDAGDQYTAASSLHKTAIKPTLSQRPFRKNAQSVKFMAMESTLESYSPLDGVSCSFMKIL